MLKTLTACTLALMLAGCVSPQQQAARQEVSDDAGCRQMGARPGTDIYVQCRMFKQQQRTQKEQADAASSAALLAYGSQMMAGPQTTTLQANCTSTRMGFQTVTNCY